MSNGNGTKSAAELEREAEMQRHRVEATIGEIKERLSPGQLLDEALSYTKHGGSHFASNLGQTLSANPLPSALLAVGLGWLMLGQKPAQGHSGDRKDHWFEGADTLGYGKVSGGLKRTSHARDDRGLWYSEFSDDAGRRYRARSEESGNRAGHFMDDSGKMLRGFMDDAGQRVEDFRDEAGNLLDEAAGWASHTWHDATSAIARSGNDAMASAAEMAGSVQHEAERITRSALHTLESQPLVAAALAFAAGAALGAALPPTRQEDEVIGKVADEVKREAAAVAGDLYEQGKQKAAEVYEDATETVGEVYDDAKRKLGSSAQQGSPAGDGQGTRH